MYSLTTLTHIMVLLHFWVSCFGSALIRGVMHPFLYTVNIFIFKDTNVFVFIVSTVKCESFHNIV